MAFSIGNKTKKGYPVKLDGEIIAFYTTEQKAKAGIAQRKATGK